MFMYDYKQEIKDWKQIASEQTIKKANLESKLREMAERFPDMFRDELAEPNSYKQSMAIIRKATQILEAGNAKG